MDTDHKNHFGYPHLRLIRVLARLRDEHYNFRWTIIGDGEEYKAIDELVRKYPRSLKATATSFLLPSPYFPQASHLPYPQSVYPHPQHPLQGQAAQELMPRKL